MSEAHRTAVQEIKRALEAVSRQLDEELDTRQRDEERAFGMLLRTDPRVPPGLMYLELAGRRWLASFPPTPEPPAWDPSHREIL